MLEQTYHLFNGKRRLSPAILILLTTLLLFVSGTSIASAQSWSFGLRPQTAGSAYFEYSIAPGEQVQDVLVVNNSSDTPLLLNVAIARGTTMAAGGITFVEETSGPAQWVTLPDAGAVELAAQSELRLPFEVAVPPGTPPGEYVAGFLATPINTPADEAESTDQAGNESSFQVVVVSQMAVAIIITVPEPTQCEASIAALTSASDKGHWRLGVQMQNTGNMHFKGSGDVIARPAGGSEVVAQSPFAVDYFIPGDIITYPVSLEPYPAAGDYEVTVNLLTDCGFQTSFTQPLRISEESVQEAVAQLQTEAEPSLASDEAAKMLAQAQLVRAVTLLVAALVALVVLGIVIVLLVKRRRAS